MDAPAEEKLTNPLALVSRTSRPVDQLRSRAPAGKAGAARYLTTVRDLVAHAAVDVDETMFQMPVDVAAGTMVQALEAALSNIGTARVRPPTTRLRDGRQRVPRAPPDGHITPMACAGPVRVWLDHGDGGRRTVQRNRSWPLLHQAAGGCQGDHRPSLSRAPARPLKPITSRAQPMALLLAAHPTRGERAVALRISAAQDEYYCACDTVQVYQHLVRSPPSSGHTHTHKHRQQHRHRHRQHDRHHHRHCH